MLDHGPAKHLKRAVLTIPGARGVQAELRERRFRSTFTACRGVYATFEKARLTAPPTHPVGFDVGGMEDLFLDRLDQVFAHDYPVLFWLGRALAPGLRVLDVGGNVGIHYHAYRSRLAYPPDLSWTVIEVPRVAAAGEALARERGASQLRFSTEARGTAADVLLSAGALQYVEQPLPELLRSLAGLPEHLILNKLPLSEGAPFVTLQNQGVSFAPMHVLQRERLLADLAELGYALADAWEDVGYPGCHVLSHPELSVPRLSGLYLRRAPGDRRMA